MPRTLDPSNFSNVRNLKTGDKIYSYTTQRYIKYRVIISKYGQKSYDAVYPGNKQVDCILPNHVHKQIEKFYNV